jgi:hypothetical protein
MAMAHENRAQALYWSELVELKVGCEYVRRYRDGLSAALTRFAVGRALVSVSALGAWVYYKRQSEDLGGGHCVGANRGSYATGYSVCRQVQWHQ